jgi:hypothetical protein
MRNALRCSLKQIRSLAICSMWRSWRREQDGPSNPKLGAALSHGDLHGAHRC